MTVTHLVAAAVGDEPQEELAEAFQGLTVDDWILAGAVLFGALLISRVVKALAARVVERDGGAGASRVAELVGRVVGGVVAVGGFVYALQVLGVRLGPLLGALGLGGLALAFAAQAILSNVFASVLLQARRPFRAGDQISTNDIEGTVEDVNLRTVVLRTYAGERVLVPCASVLGAPIYNFTTNKVRRTTVEVGVAYHTDLATAQRKADADVEAPAVGAPQDEPAGDAAAAVVVVEEDGRVAAHFEKAGTYEYVAASELRETAMPRTPAGGRLRRQGSALDGSGHVDDGLQHDTDGRSAEAGLPVGDLDGAG
ncbi:MAG: mechanosensitive ion channel family protein, partial [Actinobacteria bacterium]|nr:mechanosensitive ion channel family protein [Actinomycetota bacterium]